MKIIGIDPGSKTSPTGVAVVKDNEVLYFLKLIPTGAKNVGEELHNLTLQLKTQVYNIMGELGDLSKWDIASEEPFLQGLANKRMNRFLGVLEMTLFEIGFNKINYIHPTSMKKLVTDSGRADKIMIANAVKECYSDPNGLIESAVLNEEWDLTDALGVARAYQRKGGIK